MKQKSIYRFNLLSLVLLGWMGATHFLQAKDLQSPIEYLVLSQAQAWNEGDAKLWGAAYTQDSTFINILGMYFNSRQKNEERHAHLFRTIFKDSHLTIEIEEIRNLSPTIVAVNAILILESYQKLPPGIVESSEGKLYTRMTYILQQQEDGAWQIVAAQNTAVSPIALPTEKD